MLITQNNYFFFKRRGKHLMEKSSLIQKFNKQIYLDSVNLNLFSFKLNNIRLFLKKNTTFFYEQLLDVSAIDYYKQTLRFEVVYQLLSITHTKRISLSVFISEINSLASVTPTYPSAG